MQLAGGDSTRDHDPGAEGTARGEDVVMIALPNKPQASFLK